MRAAVIPAAPALAPRRATLAWAPALTVAAFVVPIGAGLAGTVAPAFGYLPAIGGNEWTLAPWRSLFAYPGFASSLKSTLVTALLATLGALAIALGSCAYLHGTRLQRRIGASIAPLLAMPHAALAIGFAFLILPSGWIARVVSPWLTGWTVPLDVLTVGHPSGLPIVGSLLLKEVPYLMLMTLGALNQVPADAHTRIAQSLGYGRVAAWFKVVLPQVYPQIRLSVYAVLSYSLSVVDVALILGPSNPPTLAVLAVRWFADPDTSRYFLGAAAAALLFALVGVAIAAWAVAEKVLAYLGRRWIERGTRAPYVSPAAATATATLLAMLALAAATIAGLALWSFAQTWRFPAALPDGLTLGNWQRQSRSLLDPALTTLGVGLAATLVALALTLACLEHEAHLSAARSARARGAQVLWLIYLPLLVPQVAFLFGTQVLLVRLGFDATLAAVIWAHLIFVLPYMFLSLADPWRAFDARYTRSALALGSPPWRVFVRVKVPILLKPLLIACAVGFAVSVGQYLPTLFAGSGRVATLTTEAVTLSAGADRRVIGTWALLQAVLPWFGYLLAALVPAALYTRRRALNP
ncbi:MAG TPA: ABC transporter permease [Burkholderiaceae bacterium]|nr:ABC transporter permease [Burkholderiaceae bacterium]